MVEGVVDRARKDYGSYQHRDWESFLEACGLRFHVVDLPPRVGGLIIGETIFLSGRLSMEEIARAAFHEAGHWLLHDGHWRFWLSRPQGHITVAKFERQAEEFAELFPDWGK